MYRIEKLTYSAIDEKKGDRMTLYLMNKIGDRLQEWKSSLLVRAASWRMGLRAN
jgi:hypothetical protein